MVVPEFCTDRLTRKLPPSSDFQLRPAAIACEDAMIPAPSATTRPSFFNSIQIPFDCCNMPCGTFGFCLMRNPDVKPAYFACWTLMCSVFVPVRPPVGLTLK